MRNRKPTMKSVWLILAAGVTAFGQAQPQAPPKGSIDGQVVNAKTGAPLKKTSIRLTMIVPPSNGGRGGTPVPAPPVPPTPPAMPNMPAGVDRAQVEMALQNAQAALAS